MVFQPCLCSCVIQMRGMQIRGWTTLFIGKKSKKKEKRAKTSQACLACQTCRPGRCRAVVPCPSSRRGMRAGPARHEWLTCLTGRAPPVPCQHVWPPIVAIDPEPKFPFLPQIYSLIPLFPSSLPWPVTRTMGTDLGKGPRTISTLVGPVGIASQVQSRVRRASTQVRGRGWLASR